MRQRYNRRRHMYDYSNINICILVSNMSWYQSQQSSLKNTEIVSDMMRLGPMKNSISYVELPRWSIWFKTRNPIPQLIKGTKFLSKYLRRERMRIICCRAAPSCYRCACRAARVRNSLRCCASLWQSILYFVFHIPLLKSILSAWCFDPEVFSCTVLLSIYFSVTT